MPRTDVLDMINRTRVLYLLPSAEAVICAYEQYERRNYNTWDYKDAGEHPEFMQSDRCVFCGDYGALK